MTEHKDIEKTLKASLDKAMDEAYELGRQHGRIEETLASSADAILYAFIHDHIKPMGVGECGDVIWTIKLPAMSDEPNETEFAASVRAAIAGHMMRLANEAKKAAH